MNTRAILFFSLISLAAALAAAQDQTGSGARRGSIPEELLRPKRGEAPYYPVDTVIGELGQGSASDISYSFANSLAAGFLSGDMEHRALAGVNAALREDFLSMLAAIAPVSYRLGGGRDEPDGAVSFLIRYIGREHGITGELFVRYVTREIADIEEVVEVRLVENDDGEEIEEEVIVEKVNIRVTGNWAFDDLILEEARTREEEQRESERQRFDFTPYERFF